jgi:hypothetical protein
MGPICHIAVIMQQVRGLASPAACRKPHIHDCVRTQYRVHHRSGGLGSTSGAAHGLVTAGNAGQGAAGSHTAAISSVHHTTITTGLGGNVSSGGTLVRAGSGGSTTSAGSTTHSHFGSRI